MTTGRINQVCTFSPPSPERARPRESGEKLRNTHLRSAFPTEARPTAERRPVCFALSLPLRLREDRRNPRRPLSKSRGGDPSKLHTRDVLRAETRNADREPILQKTRSRSRTSVRAAVPREARSLRSNPRAEHEGRRKRRVCCRT